MKRPGITGIAAGALILGFLVLSGCLKQKGSPPGPEGTAKENTLVTVWTKNRHDADYMQAKVNEYNRYNRDNIEVQYEIYSDNYFLVVDMAFQSGNAPDIFVFQEDIFFNHRRKERYADLFPFMDENFKETFGDLLWEGINVIDGKCYYVPTTATACRLFYNKNIFKRAGITGVPETLEEMVEAAKKISAALGSEGIYGFAINLKNPVLAFARSLTPMAERSIGIHRGFDYARGEYDFTRYAAMLESWKELLSPGTAFPGCESLDIDPLRSQFAAGKIGMYFSFSHAEPGVYANQFPMEEEWGAAQIPVSGGIVRGAQGYNANNGYLFNAEGKNTEAAWKVYTDLLVNIDILTEYYRNGLGVSLVPEVIKRSAPASFYRENTDLFITPADAIWPFAPHEINPEAVAFEGLDDYFTFAVIVSGNLDTAKELADLSARYNQAYRAGISRGTGQEIRIPDFDPKNPQVLRNADQAVP
jgi:multiple sugar transport system substrate-binding protein